MSTYEVTVSQQSGYASAVYARGHELRSDEPGELGGTDTGPSPWELLLAGMASCTAITVQMYADRKGWELGGVEVSARMDEEGAVHMGVDVLADLDDDQRARLEQIASRCPVVKAVQRGIPVTKDVVVHAG
jgi:putative redox protein